jgi:hypothetical protein
MKKTARKQAQRRRATPAYIQALKWALVACVVALVVYVVSQGPGVAFDEDAIAVVNFSGLTEADKKTALVAANKGRCGCGCGMTLAQCVATDMTCPRRTGNIELISKMIREASTSILEP